MGYKLCKKIETPKDDTKIWRYIDFTQFIAILENESLHFNRANNYDDPFEGTLPKAVETHYKELYKSGKIDDSIYDLYHGFMRYWGKYKWLTFINCWHINPGQSAAMWDLHLKSDDGTAIQTTIGKLKEALRYTDEDVYLGKVEYIDYEEDDPNSTLKKMGADLDSTLKSFFMKRKSFEHEQELRAVIQDLSPIKYTADETFEDIKWETIEDWYEEANEETIPEEAIPTCKGKDISVDRNKLIERIYIAPNAENWMYELTKSVMERYGFEDKEVRPSDLYREPR